MAVYRCGAALGSLLIAFRSMFVSLAAAVMNLLSIAAAYGLLVDTRPAR